jgi:glycerophosphoryl diester phosphodiesterase
MTLLADGPILVHGHRGARARFPESTIPAFRYAIKSGVDALESDMAVTKDGVIVMSHDPVLHPPVCSGPVPSAVIHQLTLKQVKEWDCGAVRNPAFATQQPIPGTRMPTLDELLNLAPLGHFDFNIETKSFPDKPELTPDPDTFVRMVLAKIREHKVESRVILQSFDFRTLRAMHKLDPAIRLSALTENDPARFRRHRQRSRRHHHLAPLQVSHPGKGRRRPPSRPHGSGLDRQHPGNLGQTHRRQSRRHHLRRPCRTDPLSEKQRLALRSYSRVSMGLWPPTVFLKKRGTDLSAVNQSQTRKNWQRRVCLYPLFQKD